MDLRIGSILAEKCRVEREIGRGAMGIVVAAQRKANTIRSALSAHNTSKATSAADELVTFLPTREAYVAGSRCDVDGKTRGEVPMIGQLEFALPSKDESNEQQASNEGEHADDDELRSVWSCGACHCVVEKNFDVVHLRPKPHSHRRFAPATFETKVDHDAGALGPVPLVNQMRGAARWT